MNIETQQENKLYEDLQAVVRSAEDLLRATSTQTGEKLQEARARAEESLRIARARISEIEQEGVRRAREAAGATEAYVRENPWQSLGVAAGIGLLLGLLVRRR